MTTTYKEVSVIRPNIQQEYGSFRVYEEGRFALTDGGGYGKTPQAIGVIRLVEIGHGYTPNTVVVSPHSAREYWLAQLNANYPELRATILDYYDPDSIKNAVNSNVIIVNHEVFGNKHTRDKVTHALEQLFGPQLVLVDEAHHTGDPDTFRYNIRKLTDAAQWVATLTATPIYDGLSDIYNLISMLEPETYPTPRHVREAYQKNPLVLGSVLNRKMLRRGDVELPPIVPHIVDLNEDQMRVYTAVLDYEDISPTEKLDQLLKASLDPALVESDLITDPALREKLKDIPSSKYDALDVLLEKAIQGGEKAVVFSPRFVDGVTRKLEQRYQKYGALRIDGSVLAGYRGRDSERERVRQLFETSPEHRVLVGHPETIGESLPLVAASQEFLLGLPYSWGRLYQMVKRVDRRGQEKDVTVTKLIANYPYHPKGSVDVGVDKLVGEKKRVNDVALRGGKVKLEDGKLVSDSPTHEKRPIVDVIYSPSQQIRRILSRMMGRSAQSNQEFLYRNEGRMARDFAEYYTHNWPFSYSGKTAEVYKRIIEGLRGSGEEVARILDAPSGPAILSRVLGIPTVNLDINDVHFEKARVLGAHPNNEYHRGFLHTLPFDDEEFDLVLCALGLNHTELERVDKNGQVMREREMAVRQQNRVSKKSAFNVQALPDYLDLDLDRLYAGLDLAGFEVIHDLSGKVVATEPGDSKFGVYIVTSRKYKEPAADIPKEYFEFSIDSQIMESKEKKRKPAIFVPSQPKLEVCTKFAFQHQDGQEDVEDSVSDYASALITDNIKRRVDGLPTVHMDGIDYIVVEKPRGLTIYEPRATVEDLLLQFYTKHPDAIRREVRKDDSELYQEFRRLNLLHMIPDRRRQ